MHIFIEPYAGVSPITQVIQSAKHEVLLNVYMLDDDHILRALKQAHARGVQVEVMIEGKPYGMKAAQVQQEESRIESTGAMVKVAPPRFESSGHHYAFDHGKWVCSMHECEIGTANYSYSAFSKNREYLAVTKNPNIVRAANAVFEADWNNQHAPQWVDKYLVLSPDNSEATFMQLLEQPGKIYVESEELGYYRPIIDLMEKKGKDLYMVLPSSMSATDKRNAAELEKYGVHIRLLSSPYIHAKAIIGDKYGFIGSENFTYTSLHSNREMGVVLESPAALKQVRDQIEKDYNGGGSASLKVHELIKGVLSRFFH